MSRVERTENPSGRAVTKNDSEQSREARGGRSDNDATPQTTPTKAEGELGDIEQALEHQKE